VRACVCNEILGTDSDCWTEQRCDPWGIEPPQEIIDGLLTDTLVPESTWGEPVKIPQPSVNGTWTSGDDEGTPLDTDYFNYTAFTIRKTLSAPSFGPVFTYDATPSPINPRKVHHKSLEQYKRDHWHDESLRRSGQCVEVSLDLPDIGVKFTPKYCHNEKFEFSMEVDAQAITKLKEKLTKTVPDAKKELYKVACLCPGN
jgi:hypothetical protein